LPNQGHAGEDGGPQIDGCESEYEHCAALGTRGDLHLVLEEGMLLIGADVNADVIGPKTFIERNAYLISVHQLVQPFLSRSVPIDGADIAAADRGGFHLQQHLTMSRLWDIHLDMLDGAVVGKDDSTHRCHDVPSDR
jgi:hypothetical protein